MEWQLCKPRALILEDIEVQLQGNKRDLDTISVETLQSLGIDKFESDLAHDLEEAEKFLAENSPYDFLLLDLGIPTKKELENDHIEHGHRFLEKVRKAQAAKAVIVISMWYVVNEVARAFRNGAVEFIAKPFTGDVLQAQVIKSWKQLLGKESDRLLGAERIADLVEYAEKGLAHRFTTCFSGLVQTVAHSTEDLEQYMHERYDLDRRKDSQDSLFRMLRKQEEAVARKQTEWSDLRSSLISPDDSLRMEKVENLLRDIHYKILPALIVKNIDLDLHDESKAEISTFADDVRGILKEIIVGGVKTLPDNNDNKQTINISVENKDEQVKITLVDQLEPIKGEEAAMINEGISIAPNRRFERAWGLSVVQQVAMRGGGRLEIAPQVQGNVVTYYVPSAT